MLKHHASLGDVQISASVVLALGGQWQNLTALDEAAVRVPGYTGQVSPRGSGYTGKYYHMYD
jgi:hypothetical protein